MTQCVLLNADYSFLNLVDWKRAVRLIAKEKVTILSYSEKTIKCGRGTPFKLPTVMKLVKLVKILYSVRIPFNKKNVITRDGFRCAYCGRFSKNLTIDHVIPRSRGGSTSYENCVASCFACNAKKRNLTPKEARMTVRNRLYHPTISEFLRQKALQMGIFKEIAELGLY
ncbi:MAG: HNH endonuclease [Desulfobacterales bacterium]